MLRFPLRPAAAIAGLLFPFPTLSQARTSPDAASITAVTTQTPSLSGPGLSHHVLASKALGQDVGYVVWTPPGYKATMKYPVIYYLHGVTGNESSDAPDFTDYLARAMAKGEIPPVIAVFPNGGLSFYRGGVESMIIDELIPLVDATYATKASADSRAVVGFSMGGIGAVRLSVTHPDLFIAASSWGGGARAELEPVLEKNAALLKKRGFAMLLINGSKDRPDAFKPLAAKCAALGVAAAVVTLPNVTHDLGSYYQQSNDQVMKFLGDRLRK